MFLEYLKGKIFEYGVKILNIKLIKEKHLSQESGIFVWRETIVKYQ